MLRCAPCSAPRKRFSSCRQDSPSEPGTRPMVRSPPRMPGPHRRPVRGKGGGRIPVLMIGGLRSSVGNFGSIDYRFPPCQRSAWSGEVERRRGRVAQYADNQYIVESIDPRGATVRRPPRRDTILDPHGIRTNRHVRGIFALTGERESISSPPALHRTAALQGRIFRHFLGNIRAKPDVGSTRQIHGRRTLPAHVGLWQHGTLPDGIPIFPWNSTVV